MKYIIVTGKNHQGMMAQARKIINMHQTIRPNINLPPISFVLIHFPFPFYIALLLPLYSS